MQNSDLERKLNYTVNTFKILQNACCLLNKTTITHHKPPQFYFFIFKCVSFFYVIAYYIWQQWDKCGLVLQSIFSIPGFSCFKASVFFFLSMFIGSGLDAIKKKSQTTQNKSDNLRGMTYVQVILIMY